jgi:outer membrane protein assembly factor BamB
VCGLALPGPGNTDAPQRIWENRKDFPYVPSPVARGDYIYFVNDAGLAGCYHARTGKRIWLERLADTGFHASPLLINGKVYATSTAGDVYVFAAEPTFRLLARNELGEVVRATPPARKFANEPKRTGRCESQVTSHGGSSGRAKHARTG